MTAPAGRGTRARTADRRALGVPASDAPSPGALAPAAGTDATAGTGATGATAATGADATGAAAGPYAADTARTAPAAPDTRTDTGADTGAAAAPTARGADAAGPPAADAARPGAAPDGAGPARASAAVHARARRVAEAALTWLGAHRDDFGLGPDPLSVGADANRTWKPLGELAQMCAVLRRRTRPRDPLHALASDLLAHAWRQTGEGRLLYDLMRLEPFATYPLEVYAAFASGGLRHPGVEDAAAIAAGSRGWAVTEQQPNRRLGVANAERRVGLAPHRSPEALLRRTWLGGLPEPWTFERTAAYTLTHVVFHLTDWGLCPQAVPADVAGYLEAWLPAWLDTCLEDQQWDLACELLVVAASLPRPLSTVHTADAWACLAQAQDTAGALPESGVGADGPVPRVFETCYHSTAMAALAAVLTVGRGLPNRAAPNRTAAGRAAAGTDAEEGAAHRPAEPARTAGQPAGRARTASRAQPADRTPAATRTESEGRTRSAARTESEGRTRSEGRATAAGDEGGSA